MITQTLKTQLMNLLKGLFLSVDQLRGRLFRYKNVRRKCIEKSKTKNSAYVVLVRSLLWSGFRGEDPVFTPQ